MDGDSIALMIVGMVIIWGGFAASIAYAIKVGRHKRDENEQ
ncbi:hypothetical protein BH24ACT26_BH24ACT26_07210 [soil metagenome]